MADYKDNPRSPMECALMLADIDSLHRQQLLQTLSIERLSRKADDIMRFYTERDCDWMETLHLLLFRYIGGDRNKEAFTQLATVVSYSACMKEREAPENVEAMLFGASGLLDGRMIDEKIAHLNTLYDYLRVKHNIHNTLYASDWERHRVRPSGHPLIRLSQITNLLCSTPNLLDEILSCRTAADVHKLLMVSCSDYWVRSCRIDNANQEGVRIGKTAAELTGINVIVPFMFVYARTVGESRLCDRALDLFETLAPESNRYTRLWTGAGVPIVNASDSQALLQLSTCYCNNGRCEECPLRKMVVSMANYRQQREEKSL